MSWVKSGLIFTALLLAFYLSSALKPTYVVGQQHKNIELEKIIPLEFSDWKVDNTLPIILGSPEQDELLDLLYSQLLSRTYVDSKGKRIMLSIAYGNTQNKASQVHLPEVCYPAQGFEILSEIYTSILVGKRIIPVKRLDTQQGSRREYVTYWIRHGDEVILSRLQQKIQSISYGLKGQIPDGLLFRVSSIDIGDDYKRQDDFVRQLFNELNSSSIVFLVGGE